MYVPFLHDAYWANGTTCGYRAEHSRVKGLTHLHSVYSVYIPFWTDCFHFLIQVLFRFYSVIQGLYWCICYSVGALHHEHWHKPKLWALVWALGKVLIQLIFYPSHIKATKDKVTISTGWIKTYGQMLYLWGNVSQNHTAVTPLVVCPRAAERLMEFKRFSL